MLEMFKYAKFMKDLVTKKRMMDFETVSHHYNAIISNNLVITKEDPGAFSIQCTIGIFQFTKMCDLKASINLMSLVIFKQLKLDSKTNYNEASHGK